MKKTNILIAMFVVIAAASVAKAEMTDINFDGKFKPQSMHDIFAGSHQIIPQEALAQVPVPTPVNPEESLIPMIEPWNIAPQAVSGNVEDICSKMSVSHEITIPVCVAGFLGKEAGATTMGAIQREWDKQALLHPDVVLNMETIAAGKNVIVKYDGKRLFLKKVSASGRWVDGNPATSWHPDVTPIPVAVPTHTVGEAVVGGFGGFASGPATALAGALAGAVHGFIQDVQNYADHGNTNDEE